VPQCFFSNEVEKVTDNQDIPEIDFKFKSDIFEIKKTILEIIEVLIFDIKKDVCGFRFDREESEPLKGAERSDMEKAVRKVENMIQSKLLDTQTVIDTYYKDIKHQLNSDKVTLDIKYKDSQ